MKKATAILCIIASMLSLSACSGVHLSKRISNFGKEPGSIASEELTLNEEAAKSPTEKANEAFSEVDEESCAGVEATAAVLLAETTAPSAKTQVPQKPTKSKKENPVLYAGRVTQSYVNIQMSKTDSDLIYTVIDSDRWGSMGYDNISDIVLTDYKGNAYYYDSNGGIFTYTGDGKEHTITLSETEKATVNKIIGKYVLLGTDLDMEPEKQLTGDPKAPKVVTGTICNDTFLVKSVNGTALVLTRYSKTNGELKEGQYACNYGNLYGSYAMPFNPGDIVRIRYCYDTLDKNVYPYTFEVQEISLEN